MWDFHFVLFSQSLLCQSQSSSLRLPVLFSPAASKSTLAGTHSCVYIVIIWLRYYRRWDCCSVLFFLSFCFTVEYALLTVKAAAKKCQMLVSIWRSKKYHSELFGRLKKQTMAVRELLNVILKTFLYYTSVLWGLHVIILYCWQKYAHRKAPIGPFDISSVKFIRHL